MLQNREHQNIGEKLFAIYLHLFVIVCQKSCRSVVSEGGMCRCYDKLVHLLPKNNVFQTRLFVGLLCACVCYDKPKMQTCTFLEISIYGEAAQYVLKTTI